MLNLMPTYYPYLLYPYHLILFFKFSLQFPVFYFSLLILYSFSYSPTSLPTSPTSLSPTSPTSTSPYCLYIFSSCILFPYLILIFILSFSYFIYRTLSVFIISLSYFLHQNLYHISCIRIFIIFLASESFIIFFVSESFYHTSCIRIFLSIYRTFLILTSLFSYSYIVLIFIISLS